MSSINVRVPVRKVLEGLKAKVEYLHSLPELEKAHEKAVEAWKASIPAQIPAGTKVDDVDVNERYGTKRGFVEVRVTYLVKKSALTDEPKETFETIYNRGSQITEIENAIRLLSMTEDEFVNASTFKSISRYL